MSNRSSSFVIVSFALATACSVGESERAGQVEQAQVDDVQSMERRSDGRFDVVCRDGRREIVTSEDILANRVCRTTSGPSGVVIYGRSDSCGSDYAIASVTSSTDCQRLSDTDAAWSVSVNGRCNNISDTTVRKACLAFMPGAVRIYGRSDSCSDDAIVAAVTSRTDCSRYSDTDAAWSVSVDGRCTNISDTTVRKACISFQPGATVLFGRSDSCGLDYAVASVTQDTDCQALNDTDPVWSVQVGGTCKNISDTTLRKACVIAQGGGF